MSIWQLTNNVKNAKLISSKSILVSLSFFIITYKFKLLLLIGMLYASLTVSYTHLDVYKRQGIIL